LIVSPRKPKSFASKTAGLVIGWLARQWVVHAPTERGKTFMLREVFPRLEPEAADFPVKLSGGGVVRARLTESIGWDLLHGRDVEQAEIRWAIGNVTPGATVVDAGANIGLFTIPLALAAGPSGRVVSFEPVPETVRRLRVAAKLSRLENVLIVDAAAGDVDGTISIRIAEDSAYSGANEDRRSPTIARRELPMVTMDSVWSDLGRPSVQLLKLDVEGSELRALRGARRMIEACRPPILAEAATEDVLSELTEYFASLGYIEAPEEGFRPYNHVFVSMRSNA
jgi:FkbM family methyltransferase